jgi:beta-lactam-binding protein with PASTA domain
MKVEEATKWIMDNRLAVKFLDRYDEQIEMGKIIECNLKEGDKIAEGTEVIITSSKGQLKMKEFQTLDEYKEWFEKYGIKYNVIYETNETVVENSIIRTSHKKDEIIKNGDTVTIYASKGGLVLVPNFNGLSKSSASSKCNSLGLVCSYTYGGYNNNLKKDTVIKQSVSASSKVEKGTSIKITLTYGPATYMPNFIGKSKSTIQSECSSKGLSCTFVYGGYNSAVNKDIAMAQSIVSGKQIYSGNKATITLSLGPAKSYNLQLQTSWFTTGSYTSTYNYLKSYFDQAAPGVNIAIKPYVDIDTQGDAPGTYIDSCSTIKFSTTVTQGRSYTICIRQ